MLNYLLTISDTNWKIADSYTISRKLAKIFMDELQFHLHQHIYLSINEANQLYKYYSNFLNKNSERQLHYFAQRIKNAIQMIVKSRTRLSILDCGCGFGTEALMFAVLGAKVLGVDLNSERLDVARKRVKYYEEHFLTNLEVTFKLCNIFRYKSEWENSFDIIYAKEFISHAYSVSKFIEFARAYLKNGGYLIVNDTNPLNFISSYMAWKDHRRGLFKYAKDPETGEYIPYAVERLFSPYALKKLLLNNGFQAPYINFYGILGPAVALPLISLIEKHVKLSILPIYEIMAVKSHME